MKTNILDPSGAKMYQQQGTRCCHPDRAAQASSWRNDDGVTSTNILIELDRIALPVKTTPSINKERVYGTAHGITSNVSLQQIASLLEYISSDCGYDVWLRIALAIFNATKGSPEGRDLFDSWSSPSIKYKGSAEIEAMWRSFRLDVPNPVTIATLLMMAKEGGADIAEIMGDKFEVCNPDEVSTEVSVPITESPSLVQGTSTTTAPSITISTPESSTPLSRYYINDIEKLEKLAVEQHHIFGLLVLMGQATVIYAIQNTGKTLIMLWLIIQGIIAGKFDPSKLIYINMDDDSHGLITKLRLAVEYGFQMVADGHQGFQAKEFRIAMEKMIATDTASGVIIVLDTLKKFVNTMKKDESADFARVIRQFVLKGGTVLALGHGNKNPGKDGKVIYSGTTDIIDDFDCGYTLSTVSQDLENKVKIVEFENIKRRGNVALAASYSYPIEPNITYDELLLSVQEVDPERLQTIKYEVETKADSEVITAIEATIRDGINSKMKLAAESSVRAGVSKKLAFRVIDKYSGNDPAIHRWSFVVRERGAKFFMLHDRPSVQPIDPASITT